MIFAGAGAFIPTPASVSAMLLGLEDAHISRHGRIEREEQEANSEVNMDLIDDLSERPVTIFNVQGPLTIQHTPPDYGLVTSDLDPDTAT